MRTSFQRASCLLLLFFLGCGGSAADGDDGGGGDDAALTDGAGADAPCGPADCSALDDACHFGVCDPVAAQCVAAPRANGTACDDGNVCTASDVCAAGACVGAPMDGVACVLSEEACATDAACVAGACVGTFPPATTCDTAPVVALTDGTQRVDGALDCVSAHHESSCGGAGSERVYRLVLAAPRRVRIEAVALEGGATDLVLSLREACATPASELACAAGVLEATLSAGEHTLFVDSPSGSGGAFAIDVTVLEPDTCAEAPDVAIPGRAGESTYLRGDTTGEGEGEFPTYFCNPTSSPDHVYRFVVTETSALRFRGEAGTTFDAYLTLLSGTCASATAIACNDDGPSSNLPELVATLAPGEYHLVVTGVYASNWGEYVVSITRL